MTTPAIPATPAPPSAEALVRSISGLAARLSELMVRETALLNSGRAREIAALSVEKADLARAYAGRWAQLKANRSAVTALPSNLLDALRDQVGRLATIAAENEKALRIMHNATDRVLGIITRAVRQQYSAGMNYTSGKAQPRRPSGMLGVALDRSL